MIYVGIDVASEKHDYFMIHKETGVVFTRSAIKIPNTETGYKKLHSDISAFCGAINDSKVRIGLESTGIYHTNIIRFLLEQNYDVMMINPILTNMARKAAKVHSAKNDNLDAQTICKYMIDNSDKFSPYTLSLYHNEALKSLSRKRFFIAVLKTYGTPKALARAHVNKVASLLRGRCKCTAEQLITAAKSSGGISEPHYAFQLMDAIEEMEHIARRIKSYDVQIKAYVDELCPNLLSIPGVGYTTAGLIAGEIRDITRFHSAESLISYCGIDVTVYESGKYKAKNCIPSKKGSKYLRYALFQVSRIIWQHAPVFRSYYEKKQAEGKHYYVILGHIQKKVIRVIYSILKNGSTYKVFPTP